MVKEIPYRDEIYKVSKEYMKKKYPEEAQYFDITWEIFVEFVEKAESKDLDLKGPTVRFGGNDEIMAPSVIHAFLVLYDEMGDTMDSPHEADSIRHEMTRLLIAHGFSHQFATDIVEFVLGKLP
ncbi:MAG: hypothetical protein HXS52_07920 [Theionarchaea archaeon]|nr:hypothetical protein [Theionarchaea archaeon]